VFEHAVHKEETLVLDQRHPKLDTRQRLQLELGINAFEHHWANLHA
jgi:hypothetical protein